jgi:hypothetical protein
MTASLEETLISVWRQAPGRKRQDGRKLLHTGWSTGTGISTGQKPTIRLYNNAYKKKVLDIDR